MRKHGPEIRSLSWDRRQAEKGLRLRRSPNFSEDITISTGYYLRQAVAARTPLGIEAQRYVDAGELVPDQPGVCSAARHSAQPAFIVQSFSTVFPARYPRLRRSMLSGLPNAVSYIEIDSKQILERITGRRIGPQGEPLPHRPQSPSPGIEVTQRSDDREEVVRERLEVYYRQTEPLLKLLRREKNSAARFRARGPSTRSSPGWFRCWKRSSEVRNQGRESSIHDRLCYCFSGS